MHEELPPLVITLWLSLFAAAVILHTIVHQFFQYLTLANLPLNLFHESSLQYIGRDCLVTWIECNPKISGDSLICQPFELQLILLEDSF
jgi:hypothetical protein